MKIVGIDPSFTSTGLACTQDGVLLEYAGIHEGGSVYKGIDEVNRACSSIASKIKTFVQEHKPDAVIIEYPAQSKSGFYLMVLHGWIISFLRDCNITLYSVPPTACDSLIKNKEHSKSYIVNYCKQNKWVPDKRINNDVCTAVVLSHLLAAYLQNNYKNKVFKVW